MAETKHDSKVLHVGSTGDEDKLKSLLQDDDATKQLEYAQKLQQLVKSDKDADENAQKAVRLLIKASEKANVEATKLLKECMQSKSGITKQNIAAVTWCVETSVLEKRVRESSKKLFRNIDHHSNKDSLPYKDFVAMVKETDMDDRIKRMLTMAGKEAGDEVTEENLSRVLSEQIQGTLNMTSSERENQSKEFKSAGVFTKVIRYPTETVQVAFQEAQDMVSTEGMAWARTLLPTNQLYMISAFFLYSFLSASLLLLVIPLLVFYVTLAVLFVATLQIVINRQNLKKSADLAKVLQKFDNNLDVDESQSKFMKNKLGPYWVFFATLPLFVAGLSLANKKYIPCSDLAVLSSIFTAITFLIFIEKPINISRWIAMFLNMFAALPVLVTNFPNIPIISKVLLFATRSFYTFDTNIGLKFNISLPSISYLLLPFVFVVMAIRYSGAGTYRTLLPFLVTQVWFSLATSLYPYTTWFGLIRASLGNAVLPVLLPFSILLSVLYAIYQAFQTSMFFKIAIAAVLGLVPLIYSQITDVLHSEESKIKTGSTKKYIMCLLGVLAFLPITSVFTLIPSSGSRSAFKLELDWPKYNRLCTSGDGNRIQQQILCSNFIGQKVTWNGTFDGAEIAKVENSIEPLLSGLPTQIVNKIRCTFGTPYGACNTTEMSANDQTVCKLKASTGQMCHFKDYNTFSFLVYVSMPNFESKLSVNAGDGFRDILEHLRSGDSVEFVATLGEKQGTTKPSFQLKDIRCTNRALPVALVQPEVDDEVLLARAANEAISTVVNFFWYPALEYAPDAV